MAPRFALTALALCFVALAGCTGGSDNGEGGTSTTSGGVGVGGTVSGPGGGVGGNATVSGSSTMTSTGSNGTEANMTADISIGPGSTFSPADVTIAVGGTVTWTHNDGQNAHTVTDDGGDFDSSPTCAGPLPLQADCLTQGEKHTATYTETGTFGYHCKIHSGMTGTVTVVEADA